MIYGMGSTIRQFEAAPDSWYPAASFPTDLLPSKYVKWCHLQLLLKGCNINLRIDLMLGRGLCTSSSDLFDAVDSGGTLAVSLSESESSPAPAVSQPPSSADLPWISWVASLGTAQSPHTPVAAGANRELKRLISLVQRMMSLVVTRKEVEMDNHNSATASPILSTPSHLNSLSEL